MPGPYLSPGVYVEEVPPLARPIAGVGTSVAGFVGVVSATAATATIEPQLITGWEEFKKIFGDFQADNSILAHAVYGFFNNGGTRCWVLGVANLDNLAENLKKLEPLDEISIVAVPGALGNTKQNAIIDHCEKMLDRIAILDGTPTDQFTVDAIKGADGSATPPASPTRDSSFAALYFPWIKVFDPTTKKPISQAPSGHIAGVYARVDSERGVYKAPANEIIRGADDLDRKLSKSDQSGLNPLGINVIRAFNGNFRIWGGRTLGGDANGEYKYISTRRLYNFLRESIDEGTQFAVFEPNSQALWQRITRNVSDFLLGQWRDGALFGDTPKQAFFVRCNAETNPSDVRERGEVVTEIGIAIVKPAEFVVFRIQQLTGG